MFVLNRDLNIRIRNNKFWIQAVLRIRICIILGSWIRIQIKVKSRIRVRIRIEVKSWKH